MLGINLEMLIIIHREREKLLELRKGNEQLLVQVGKPFPHLLLDNELAISLQNIKIGLQNVQNR